MTMIPFCAPLFLLAAVSLAVSSAATPSFLHPPLHPLLASRGPWPTCHGDAWATDTSSYPGPSNSSFSAEVVSVIGIWNNSYLPISLVFGDDYVWGTSVSSTLLLSEKNGPLEIVDTYWNGFDFSFHGAYSFVTSDGVYFSSSKKGFYAFATTVVAGRPKIVKRGQFELPFRPDYPKEVVVAVQEFYPNKSDAKATHEGLIAVATTAGLVAVVSRTLSLSSDGIESFKVEATLQLPRTPMFPNDAFVSNSIALDQNGGVYVVSATHLSRIQWFPETRALAISWHTPYAPAAGDPLLPSRLGRGSGSTPSLMYGHEGANPGDAPRFVVITDGASPMNVLLFSALGGAISARTTVEFSSSKDSTSEQSIVVLGQRVVVVQNWIPDERLPLPCKALASAHPFIGKMLPDKLLMACANLLGAYPLAGVAQYEVRQAQKEGTVKLHMTWMNDKVQCSSCIPAASSTALGKTGALEDAMFYCLGMEDRQQGPTGAGFVGLIMKAVNDFLLPSAAYTIEGLSWADGRQIVKKTLGTGNKFNPSYAAVQIGRKRDLVIGTVTGVLHVSYDLRVLPEPKSALRVWTAEEVADYLCTHFSAHTAIALFVVPTILFAIMITVIATKVLF
jgi:hypothetical protein